MTNFDDDSLNSFLVGAATAGVLGVDTEGTTLKTKKNGYVGTDYRDGTGFAYGISVAYRSNGEVRKQYFPIKHERNNVSPAVYAKLILLLEKHPSLVFHNAIHDLVALETLNIYIQNNWYCTLLMTHMIDENLIDKSLDFISSKLLGRNKEKSEEFEGCLAIFGWTPRFPSEVMSKYAGTDAELALLCFEIIHPEFKRQGFDG